MSVERWDRELQVAGRDGTRLWVGTRGSGRPVVLCDGLGCDGFVWRSLVGDLSRDMMVVRWHYRSHGRSAPSATSRGLRIEEFARDLRRIMDRLGLKDVVLCGHSLGVQVILECALQDAAAGRRRIAALVPICGSPGRVLDTFKGTELGLHVLPRVRWWAARVPGVVRWLWRRGIGSPAAVMVARAGEVHRELMPVDALELYLTRMSMMDPEAFLSTLASAARHDATDRLCRIGVPSLVIAAERDTFTPLERSVTMRQRLVGSEFFVLPDATHAGPLEWPDMVALRLRKFFRERLDGCPPGPLSVW
ncbi:MAG: alpha/beta hydrolase [Deltaproteobacteria bacterium]|nr:MAG: alpha/beta hydrolase [Deltaproteobacteria bacterium]